MQQFIIFFKHNYTLQYFLQWWFHREKDFNFTCDMDSDKTSSIWRQEVSQFLNMFDFF